VAPTYVRTYPPSRARMHAYGGADAWGSVSQSIRRIRAVPSCCVRSCEIPSPAKHEAESAALGCKLVCTALRQRVQAQAGQGDMWKSVCATAEVVCATEAPSRVSRKRVCYRSLRSCVRASGRAACVRVRVLSLLPEQRHRRFLGLVTWCWAGCSVGWEGLGWFWVVR
jgi:hypothetical protein